MTTNPLTPASPSARLGAWFVDVSIAIALMLVVMYRYSGGFDVLEFVLQTNYPQLLVLFGLPLFVHIVATTSLGASLGMYAMDLEIVQDCGKPVTLTNAMRRPLGLLVTCLTGGLAAALPFVDAHRRTVGDMLSGIRVVDAPGQGRRIAYDAWRLFRSSLRMVAPVTIAIAIAALLIRKDGGPNKTIVLDALLLAGTLTLLIASLVAVLRTKLTRVRLSAHGIQRSGWFGWKKGVVGWQDIDFARYRHARLCPYFEVHRHNRRRFRVPVEHDTAQLTAGTFANFGVRIEH